MCLAWANAAMTAESCNFSEAPADSLSSTSDILSTRCTRTSIGKSTETEYSSINVIFFKYNINTEGNMTFSRRTLPWKLNVQREEAIWNMQRSTLLLGVWGKILYCTVLKRLTSMGVVMDFCQNILQGKTFGNFQFCHLCATVKEYKPDFYLCNQKVTKSSLKLLHQNPTTPKCKVTHIMEKYSTA